MKNEEWESFYKTNPDKFIEDHFDIKLTWYQKAMLKIVDKKSVIFPRHQGRHNAIEQMEFMRRIMNLDKE